MTRRDVRSQNASKRNAREEKKENNRSVGALVVEYAPACPYLTVKPFRGGK
ncbi:hypothetical protein WN55_01169 [Dufourea novaeangliae]|uniref:Uncharacterized protein n=1 Tax=Dufourea novaeangliae TaxID=178035 RepID=A0A154PE84_DUFNO|nr:hypothetical protein WN55_01169 [Dufourea novaeangliae]